MTRALAASPNKTSAPGQPAAWVWPLVLLLVTLLALALRWYYITTAVVIHPVRGDAVQYYSYAWNLAHHGVFASNSPGSTALTPSSYRPPGYPFFLALWMKLTPSVSASYTAVLFFQALLGALTVTCAMQLGRRWLNWQWAAAAGVLMAIWPHSITITSFLLTETLFGFLCALALLLCARACDRQSMPWMVLAGLCFGACALTKTILLPFGILLALYLAARRYVPRKLCVTLIVAALALPAAWAVRNTQLPHSGNGHTSTGRALQNIVQGSWPGYYHAYHAMINGSPKGKHKLSQIDHAAHQMQLDPVAGTQAILHRLEQRPWHYLEWYMLEKPRLLWGWRIRMGQNDIYVYPTVNSPFDTQPAMRVLVAVCQTINPVLAALMLVGLVLTLARRTPRINTPPAHSSIESTWLLLVFATLIYVIFQSEPRYSIPFRAFEMLMVITSVQYIVHWLRLRVHASREMA